MIPVHQGFTRYSLEVDEICSRPAEKSDLPVLEMAGAASCASAAPITSYFELAIDYFKNHGITTTQDQETILGFFNQASRAATCEQVGLFFFCKM